jgi:Spy/CpxP family protein refolding chaperone
MIRLAPFVLALATAGALHAEPFRGGPDRRPPFLEHLFPPVLVMRNQGEIGLTDGQRDAITRAMAKTEKQLVDLRWQFEGESEKLTRLLRGTTVDESAAMAQAAKVMDVEQRMKRAHLALLVRIKNQLTPAQQETLATLRPARPRRRPRPETPAP